jgi:ABC-2 type transport system ATP-binding protein
MEEAEYCHRLALMNRGRLIALDTPVALRSGMTEPVLEVRTDDGVHAIDALAGAPFVRAAGLFGRAVHVTLDGAAGSPAALEVRLREQGVRFESVVPIEPTLEHVFIARVQSAGGAVED